jgi:hypothetical protein
MNLGSITLNPQGILDFLSQPPLDVFFQLFSMGGWTIFAWLLLYAGIEFFLEIREDKYKANWEWVLLAVDIPPMNLQTPKAVEQLFAHIAGAYEGPNIEDKFWHGVKQRPFSFEIISIEGYIQFLIRTERKFQELVETAVYAQYPDAEIVEVEDYTADIPNNFPNDTHDMWCSDFGLAEKNGFPIRTYKEFEHNISKDTILKDPVGTFLESLSRIGTGEQMWFQIIIEPIGSGWKEKVIEDIKELIGEKKKAKRTVSDEISDGLLKSIVSFGDQVFNREASEATEEKKDEKKNLLQYLTPGQSKLLEGMEEKISKIGFKTKIRGMYLARKEVFNPDRGVHAMIGAINQFNIPTANSIVPTYSSAVSYFFKEQRIKYRKELLMKAFKKRKHKIVSKPFILNIEELATIWHFPMSHVKTPLLQKAEGKRVEPPSQLPTEALPDMFAPEEVEETGLEKREYLTDSGDVAYEEGPKFG